MLYYDRIDIRGGIDLAKSNSSKKCMVCHYRFFKHGLKIQDSGCNCCQDLRMLWLSKSDIALIFVKDVIIAALFITLANLKQFKLREFTWRSWEYIKNVCTRNKS